MSTIIRRYPALSLLILAMVFGVAPVAAVNAGLLPQGASQLGALSASLAGITLAAIEVPLATPLAVQFGELGAIDVTLVRTAAT